MVFALRVEFSVATHICVSTHKVHQSTHIQPQHFIQNNPRTQIMTDCREPTRTLPSPVSPGPNGSTCAVDYLTSYTSTPVSWPVRPTFGEDKTARERRWCLSGTVLGVRVSEGVFNSVFVIGCIVHVVFDWMHFIGWSYHSHE